MRLLSYSLATLIAFYSMRTWAIALPSLNLLFSQSSAKALPAWIYPEYTVTSASQDLENNKLGAVASESSICSSIGIDMLRQGGNAADALVATTLCVGVIGMYHRYVKRRVERSGWRLLARLIFV